jgi:glucokinase
MLLAGDIGGTKTDLALFSAAGGPRNPAHEAEFHSANYPDLSAMVREFLAARDEPIDHACFDVAGPVIDGCAKITNLPWVVDANALARELRLPAVDLLNDLTATAYAIPILEPKDLDELSAGSGDPQGARAVIAPGTGLGEAFLTWDGGRFNAHASEGGHSDFAPAGALQSGLLDALRERLEHVSVERVCSGSGIPNIYRYLKDSGYAPESPAIAKQIAAAPDPTPVIMDAALDPAGRCPLCVATLDTFVEILGAEAGNLALKVLATGGVYLAGGIPPRIVPTLREGRFLQAFRRKGRLSSVMARMPVYVIVQQAALIGAASYGLMQMGKTSGST